jgi:hypothetical protein
MIRVLLLGVALIFLASCSIPANGIRPDGTLVIYMFSPNRFRVGSSYFTESTLEVALNRLSTSSGVRNVEALIPISLLGPNKLSCEPVGGWYLSTRERWRWQFFEWTPDDENSKKELPCDIPVVAALWQSWADFLLNLTAPNRCGILKT